MTIRCLLCRDLYESDQPGVFCEPCVFVLEDVELSENVGEGE